MAERLTRDDAVDLVLVEAGPAGADDTSLRMSMLPIGPASDRVVHHAATAGFDLPRGRGLGGSSVVNGGYFMRWHPGDFVQWDQRWWDPDTVAHMYADIDGGTPGGGTMSVRRFTDDELHPWAHSFESHWLRAGYDPVTSVVPAVGVNRVRSNSRASLRVSADRVYLQRAIGRSNLAVRAGHAVDRLLFGGGRVTGVLLETGETISADETILCAGTLASAALISRSAGVAAVHRIAEHRELLVRFRPGPNPATVAPASRPLLPTVLHTADRMEIRCYNGDFASFIDGVPPSGPAVGIALMAPTARGTLSVGPTGEQTVDLGGVDDDDIAAMNIWAQRVVEMLDGPDFAGLVESGSAAADPEILTSQHAWGALPMGTGVDWTGQVVDTSGLRVVDGSILPTAGSSGPHETLMMVAARIAETMCQ